MIKYLKDRNLFTVNFSIDRYIFGFIILIIFILLFVFCFGYKDLANFFFKNNNNSIGEFTKILITIIGGIIATIALRINYKRTLKFEESVENQNTELHLNTQQKIHDRFNNALQQLSSDKDYVVIGALHSLREIVENSDEEDDYYVKTIFNVFTGFIRSELTLSNLKRHSQIKFEVLDLVLFNFLTMEKFKNTTKNLRDLNLSKLEFNNLDIENVDFSNSQMPKKINYVNFIECRFDSSKFGVEYSFDENDKSKIYDAFESPRRLAKVKFIKCKSSTYLSFSCLNFDNVDFKTSFFPLIKLYRSDLNIVDFHDLTRLNWPKFCSFNNVKFGNQYFVKFIACCFGNFNFNNQLNEVDFIYCNFQNSSLKSLKNNNLMFVNCAFEKNMFLNHFQQKTLNSTIIKFDDELIKTEQDFRKNLSISKDVLLELKYLEEPEIKRFKEYYFQYKNNF